MINLCDRGGNEPQGWLRQLWQWQDYNGGGWFSVVAVGLVIFAIMQLAAASALAWEKKRIILEEDELTKELEMWQDTEIWDD